MNKPPLIPTLWLGMSLGGWLRLLARNRFAISPSKIPAALVITLAAALNSTLRAIHAILAARRTSDVELADDPIFIIGHWRTGTTMLHELLALDGAHRAPTTYESLAPNHFPLTERLFRRFIRAILPRTRPFDNMRMSLDRPQEDECALALRGVPSPFLSVAFPRRGGQFPPYVDLEDLTPRQLADWKRNFRFYLQMLVARRPGRLVLKSPQHANRIPALLAMFPRARFIHIVRDPFVVFPSTMHFWRTMHEHYGLQGTVPILRSPRSKMGQSPSPDDGRLREQVFADFAHMHERVEQTRTLVPPGQFYELRYEELVADPVAAMAAIYAFLGRDDFSAIEPAIAHYAHRSGRYKTNEYELDPATRSEITERWSGYLAKHGYLAR
jgi:hypothetical protein